MTEKNKFKREIDYPKDFEFKYISGAFGGFLQNDKFVMTFFNDVPDIPDFEMIEILEDGSPISKLGPDKKMNGSRKKIIGGFMMDREVALALYKWLDISIKEYDKSKSSSSVTTLKK
jgi:hypothetical protein